MNYAEFAWNFILLRGQGKLASRYGDSLKEYNYLSHCNQILWSH